MSNPLRQFNFIRGPASNLILPASSILVASVTFNSADIDVFTTTKTLVNAPGANRVIVPIAFYFTKNSYAAAPVANPIPQMYYANDVGGTTLLSDTPTIGINVTNAVQGGSTRFSSTGRGTGAIPQASNQAIVMRGNIIAPGGSATKSITFTLFYAIRVAQS